MIGSRFGLLFSSVLAVLIVAGARAAAAHTDAQLAESAALQSIVCEDMTSGSSKRVWATVLNCGFLSSGEIKPAGCIAKTVSGHTVSLTLTNCKSPHSPSITTGVSLKEQLVTGSVDAVFKKDAAGLHVHTTGTGVKIGGATLVVDNTTTYHSVATVETVSVSHSSSGVDAHGHSVSNTGSFTSADDTAAGCITLNGNWKLKSNGVGSSVAAINVKRCNAAGTWLCPSGAITMENFSRNTVTTATYNGSSVSTVKLPNGTSELAPVPCIP